MRNVLDKFVDKIKTNTFYIR